MVLGDLPMLQDVFWAGLAVTNFFGLIAGTILTMVMAPTLYALALSVDVLLNGWKSKAALPCPASGVDASPTKHSK